MTMTCRSCGGACVWRGPLSALTHTECTQCGAVDNQEPEEVPEQDSEGGHPD